MPLRLEMTPATGDRRQLFVGDRLRIDLAVHDGQAPDGTVARLRTTLGRDAALRREALTPITGPPPVAAAAWRDIRMHRTEHGWTAEVVVTEPGWFLAKAYLQEPSGAVHWPAGDDLGVVVHPAWTRSGNTIYCAFTRMFGDSRTQRTTTDSLLDSQLAVFDDHGYNAIPPSGTLRNLIGQLDHIVSDLGCRIVHLLPVNPTPTTYARFGRYGSPYAAQDLTAIDPALVEFDKQATGIDQFCELTRETHRRGARVFLDLAINHTGWGSWLQERHPEWFVRNPDGTFHSPGAWGTTWEDLVELDHRHLGLWQHLIEAFLTWCRRGVDGFRCDAGYMVPMPVWRAITAAVRAEFPDAVFLLEGLGGAWEATESLLTEGGMHWAYSELFQNYTGEQVASYSGHAIRQSGRVGLLVNYSETHDNARLAERGRTWSLLRNRLCALLSQQGGFGFTAGVEWLADEKLNVHSSRGMNWDADDNIVDQLATLNRLLLDHPCFRDGADIRRLSDPTSSVFLCERRAPANPDLRIIVLANTDEAHAQDFALPMRVAAWLGSITYRNLLEAVEPLISWGQDGGARISLAPGQVLCLGERTEEIKAPYRACRSRHAFAVRCLSATLEPEQFGPFGWQELAALVDNNPEQFLTAVSHLDHEHAQRDLIGAIQAVPNDAYPAVMVWDLADQPRVIPVPPKHWLLVRSAGPFRLHVQHEQHPVHQASTPAGDCHVVALPPGRYHAQVVLTAERQDQPREPEIEAVVDFLPTAPPAPPSAGTRPIIDPNGTILLTNDRGAMCRMAIDLGRVHSKYDCLLGANLHPTRPVDRHVLAKRLRAWLIVDGFTRPIDGASLVSVEPGPPATWRFSIGCGDGQAVVVDLLATMVPKRNAVVLAWRLPDIDPPAGRRARPGAEIRITMRVDLEDRSFHSETIASPEAEAHFRQHTAATADGRGFAFSPADDRLIRVGLVNGHYHHGEEWSKDIAHPYEGTRGQRDRGDAWSPGWFEWRADPGANTMLILDAEPGSPLTPGAATEALATANQQHPAALDDDHFATSLAQATDAYVVDRDDGRTVIAGYPWFLDWGRDTLICARGMLAAGRVDEVVAILRVFGRFAEHGTLPNCIHGDDASNRETSDAPLWYGVVCEEAAEIVGETLWQERVVDGGATFAEVLRDLAIGHLNGTPTGVKVDHDSGLVWSPSHFTWMDTNHPAGTPRTGYPIEIQVLWWRLLQRLAAIDAPPYGDRGWSNLAARVHASILERYWLPERGWLADCLLAANGESAADAVADDALRSNCLLAIALGAVSGEAAQATASAAIRYLVVPGALRSLAPVAVSVPLVIPGPDGEPLGDPLRPYRGHYQGNEDTLRKPAYHNGTAWVWPLAGFAEAVAMAWPDDPLARQAGRAWLAACTEQRDRGCLGHLPEIIDGSAPHAQRGCDAQAWSATEVLRAWLALAPTA